MRTGLTHDIYYDIAKYIEQPSACLNLCLASRRIHQALYPHLIRIDFSRITGRKSLWKALEDDNTAQLETIYAVMYPDFSEYVTERPNDFNFWLQYVATEGVYGGLNCLRLMLARAAAVGFVPSMETLSAAVEAHNLEAIELLIEYGAPLTRQDEGDDSGPLFRVRSVDMVHYLLARGADPLEKFEGMNLLHWHCSQIGTSPLLIETLIEAGVPVDELDTEGCFERMERRTPLGHACADINLPAIRTLLRHGANPFGASTEKKAERSRDAGPHEEYEFPYPLESLMNQTIRGFGEIGWGQCLWDHHISLLHEEQDDMEQEVEERDTVLPLPSILTWNRISVHEFFNSRQGCYECGRGYFLADIESDVSDEAEKEKQAGLLRFESWTSQMRRFVHRYFRGIQILLEAGGLELCRTPDFNPVDMWHATFPKALLRAGFCFSPYSGIVRDYVHEASDIHALVEWICEWDFVATTCVQQLDYLLDSASHRSTETGLESFRRVLERLAGTIMDHSDGEFHRSLIIVELDPVAPFIGPSRRDPSVGWTQRYLAAWELDLSQNVSAEIYQQARALTTLTAYLLPRETV
ncbi:hypothetical protein F4782DRAFT_551017 [Xylaria castorea]|nr:hypothetical protein F4782DRAFT_551017 [Xylaria castorea]